MNGRDGARRGRGLRGRPYRFRDAVRVAGAVAAIMAFLYVAVTVAFDYVDSRHLVAQVDANLHDRLASVLRDKGQASDVERAASFDDTDVDQAPVVVWRVAGNGRATALSDDTPALPAAWPRTGGPSTVLIGRDHFRLLSAPLGNQWVVVGQSMAETQRVESVVERAELVAGPVLVAAMFLLAFGIGVMASRPVELARRRQLEFTADASHELRTPLTVIEAEVGLALTAERDGQSYRDTLQRIATEGRRLRRIVEDLLFLARSDSMPPPPSDEPVDVGVLVDACVQRFYAVAQARRVELSVVNEGAEVALIDAAPEPLDRLCGVLVDNACRYTPPGGSVRAVVTARGNAVTLAVQDSGPGIPPGQRAVLFDRFRRGTDQGEGSGLGLAIADAVVKATGGRWRVAESPYGGAQMEVTWRRSHYRGDGGADRRRRLRAQVDAGPALSPTWGSVDNVAVGGEPGPGPAH